MIIFHGKSLICFFLGGDLIRNFYKACDLDKSLTDSVVNKIYWHQIGWSEEI